MRFYLDLKVGIKKHMYKIVFNIGWFNPFTLFKVKLLEIDGEYPYFVTVFEVKFLKLMFAIYAERETL